MARVTLQTIADRVGVSRMTVSNAFSRPDQLSSQLRDEILSAAEELGYAGPDPSAAGLGTRHHRRCRGAADRLHRICVHRRGGHHVPRCNRRGARAHRARAHPVVGHRPRSDDPGSRRADGRSPRLLVRHGINCGRMVEAAQTAAGVSSTRCLHREFRASTSTTGRAPAPRPNTSSISGIDGSTSSRRTSPASAGSSRDPLGAADNHVIKQRLLGWFDALHAAGIEPTVVQEGASDDSPGSESAHLLLDADDRPTAILCFSDVIAYGVVQTANSLDLSVPDDLSVVGFDDNPLAKRMRPALTTVRQDVAAKGHAAAAALTTAIARARSGSATQARVRHVLLPTELIVRGSTAKPAIATVATSVR